MSKEYIMVNRVMGYMSLCVITEQWIQTYRQIKHVSNSVSEVEYRD